MYWSICLYSHFNWLKDIYFKIMRLINRLKDVTSNIRTVVVFFRSFISLLSYGDGDRFLVIILSYYFINFVYSWNSKNFGWSGDSCQMTEWMKVWIFKAYLKTFRLVSNKFQEIFPLTETLAIYECDAICE